MKTNNFFAKIPAIKSHYEFLTPLILERSKKFPHGWISPYCDIEWQHLFSPIEEITWNAIRCFGRAPLYPQYPVSKYFLDFGNPALKIGVECDGKEFHTDKEKDERRDKELETLGWTIYRISGKDCNQSEELYGEDYETLSKPQGLILNNYYTNTVEGLIKSISIFHFGYKLSGREFYEHKVAGQCLRDRATTNYDHVCAITRNYEMTKAGELNGKQLEQIFH